LNAPVENAKKEIHPCFPKRVEMKCHVCVEAGHRGSQCIACAARLRASYAAVAEEFEIVRQEMKAGKDRSA